MCAYFRSCPQCGKLFIVQPWQIKANKGKFCNKVCRDKSNNIPLEKRFESSIHKIEDGCWLWIKSINKYGYGVIKINHKSRYAHRLSFEIFKGLIPDEAQVLHTCDVRSCVNPQHLFLGTNVDNMADKVSKGRQARGEGLPQSKLTELQIRDIRSRYAEHKASQAELARQYGVSQHNVYRIIHRMNWKHVP